MVKYHAYWTKTALPHSQLLPPGLSSSGSSWSFWAPHSMQCMSSALHPWENVVHDLIGTGRLVTTLGLISWSTYSTCLSQCSESTNRSCVRTLMSMAGLERPRASVMPTIYFLPETSWALSLPVQFYLSGAFAIRDDHVLPQQCVLSIQLSRCWNTV